MKKNIFLPVCLFLLSATLNLLSAQEIDTTTKGLGNSTYSSVQDSLRRTAIKQEVTILPKAVQSCVNSFSNQTITLLFTVNGCDTLNTQNITVTNTGNLSLLAPTAIVLNPTFLVQQGGVLYVNLEQLRFNVFDYGYDNSGNRITRVYHYE